MLESEFREVLLDDFEAVGCLVLTVHGHQYQASGWPDVQVYHPVWTGHLELKRGRNPPTAGQRHRIVNLRRRGTPAFVLALRGEDVALENSEGVGVAQLTGWRLDRDRQHRGRLLLVTLHLASRVIVGLRDFDMRKWAERGGVSSVEIADVVKLLRDPEV